MLTIPTWIVWWPIVCLLRILQFSSEAGDNAATIYSEDVTYPTLDYGPPLKSSTLLTYEFGNSWGHPAVVQYNPPGIDFNKVKLHVKFTSRGIQFDRLAHIYLENVEIWRPSTPEPGNFLVEGNATIDASHLLPLFQEPGELVFQLDNIVDSTYTGPIQASLSIEYYKDDAAYLTESTVFTEKQPSRVEAVSQQLEYLSGNNLTARIRQLSRNTTKVGLYIHASGNANEEFWYTASQNPLRVLSLYINGDLAGLVNPFPQIYTGGFQPNLWNPLVGIRAYDVPSSYIDVSTFLPDFWEAESSLNLSVGNSVNSDSVGSNWLVNVALLIWEEDGVEGAGTRHPSSLHSQPSGINLPHVKIFNQKLKFGSSADLSFDGKETLVQWQQSLRLTNIQNDESSTTQYVHSGISSDELNLSGARSGTYSLDSTFPLVINDNEDGIIIVQALGKQAHSPLGSFEVKEDYNGTWTETTKQTQRRVQFKTLQKSVNSGNQLTVGRTVKTKDHTIYADLPYYEDPISFLSFIDQRLSSQPADSHNIGSPKLEGFEDEIVTEEFGGFIGKYPVRKNTDESQAKF